MPYYAADSLPTDIPAILTAIGLLVGGVLTVLKISLNQASKDRESERIQAAKDRDSDRQERKLLVQALEKMAKSNEKIAEETAQGNREAKERNGHLGEQNVELSKQSAVIVRMISCQSDSLMSIKDSSEANLAANTKISKILENSAIIANEDRPVLMNAAHTTGDLESQV